MSDAILYIHESDLNLTKEITENIEPDRTVIFDDMPDSYVTTILIFKYTIAHLDSTDGGAFTDECDRDPPYIVNSIHHETPHENIYRFMNTRIDEIIDSNTVLPNCYEIDLKIEDYTKYEDKLDDYFPALTKINIGDYYTENIEVYNYDDYKCSMQCEHV